MHTDWSRKNFFENHPDPMWVYDLETLKFLDVNAAAIADFGYARDDFLGMTIADIRPEEDVPALHAALAQVRSGFYRGGTWRLRKKSGELMHADIRWHTMDLEGARAVLASIRDVTRIVELEAERERLLDQERQARLANEGTARLFESLFEAVPGKLVVVRPGRYEIVAVSDAFLQSTMTRREAIRGQPFFAVFPDDPNEPANGAQSVKASFARVVETRTTEVMGILRYPVRVPETLGGGFQDRYWTSVNSPVEGPDGSVAFIIHRVEDVTDLVLGRGEIERQSLTAPAAGPNTPEHAFDILLQARELKLINDRLLEQEANLRTAQRLLKLGMWKFDLKLNALLWSDETYEIYGTSRERFAGSFQSYVELVHPDDRERMAERYRMFEASGSTHLEFQHRVVADDGRTISVRGIGERVTTPDGQMISGVVQDVTQELAAAANLAEAHALLAIAGRAARLGGWRVNVDPLTVTWTPGTAAIHETPDDYEPTVEDALAFYAPEDRPRIEAVFRECMTNGTPFDEVLHIETAKGRHIVARAIGEALRDPDGRIVAVQGAFQDMSEIVALKDLADSASRRLEETLESISDAFLTVDEDWRFSYVNRQAEVLLDRRRADLIGKSVWSEFPEAVGSTFQREYERAVDTRQTVNFTEYYPPLEKWFEVSAYPTPDGLAVYFRDVTKRRRNEEHLRLLESAVSRQNDILIITKAEPIDGPDGPEIVYVNDAFVRRTGFSREEAIGRTPRLLQGPKTDRAVLDQIRSSISDWRPIRVELLNYTKAGEEFWLEIDIVPIADPTGWYTHWVAIERDITERRELEDRLRQSQKLEAIGQLTGGVAHDFNNLLTVILGNAEILAEQLEDRHLLRKLADMTVTAAERGAELTNRLLAFARRQPLKPTRVDVNRLVEGMDGLIRRTMTEDIEIEISGDGGLWAAEVDPSQLEVALLNLVINARDAMPNGGRLTIETANATLDDAYCAAHEEVDPGRYVMISVSDTGTGMPREIIDRAFEPFFTTKDIGKGSGLGLSMVYGFVKQSRGHVKIYSELDEGTTVRLYLPSASADTRDGDRSPQAEETVGGRELVLVVEDDALVRDHVVSLLESLGYRVHEAASGDAALTILKGGAEVDLLFTDIVMPGGMNGRDLAEAALLVRPSIKVLFTSGYTENAIVHHGRLDRGVNLLSKPYRRQDLAAKIRDVLDGTKSAP